jgi:hypothetical protein
MADHFDPSFLSGGYETITVYALYSSMVVENNSLFYVVSHPFIFISAI